MLDAWGDNAAVRQTLEEASTALGEDIGRLIREGPKERLDLTDQHPAGDAHRRHRLLPRLAGRNAARCRRSWPGIRSASTPRWSPPARSRSPTRCRWCAFAPRRCRRRCRSAPARWRRSSGSMRRRCAPAAPRPREATGEVVAGGQLQRSEADRHRRQQGRRRQGLRAAQGGGRQAGAAAAGLGAVPLAADEAGRRAAAREAGDASRSSRPRSRSINNIDVRSETDPAAIRDALYRQAFGPVRWVETIRAIRARGVADIFECGPGKVLAGLTRRIDADVGIGARCSIRRRSTAARALLA